MRERLLMQRCGYCPARYPISHARAMERHMESAHREVIDERVEQLTKILLDEEPDEEPEEPIWARRLRFQTEYERWRVRWSG